MNKTAQSKADRWAALAKEQPQKRLGSFVASVRGDGALELREGPNSEIFVLFKGEALELGQWLVETFGDPVSADPFSRG